MKSAKFYTIWFSQRNGSSLLCEGLKSTGVLGKPEELFTIGPNETLLSKHQAKDYRDLQRIIYDLGTSSNGVFGVKTNAPLKENDPVIAALRQCPNARKAAKSNYATWESMFPNCQHIFLTRRNKVRQAVSWWKAIVTKEWHRKSGDKLPVLLEDLVERYNFNALKHLLIETTIRESKIQAFLAEGQQQALTIVYEDFVKDYQGTILQIADFLGEVVDPSKIGQPYYVKLADIISDEWVERFRKELQKDWSSQIW
ncbi:MAG: Stf0 family sulfotransferase [Bacteroidota bacterium]